MNKAERNAIKSNMAVLNDEIESDLFVSFLRMKGILDRSESKLINDESSNNRVLTTFDLLMPKEMGWDATIQFLQQMKYVNTVEKLKLSSANYSELADVTTQMRLLSTESLSWRQFIRDVTDFYLGDYRVVESFDVDGDSDLIESVWVDLQLEGSREPIGGYKEIFAQMRAKNCRLAIVRGQPGSGKTTLAKKIAYDWAKGEKTADFDLILAVPLRDVQSKSDLLEMAVRFYLGNADGCEAKRICENLRREKLKILIILEGLDEFQLPTDSPLSMIFGSAPDSFHTVQTKPVRFDFDLMVTSRPFACQLIHANIAAVKYEIVGFTEEKQVEFVGKRCKKPEGKAKAIEYFSQSNCLKEISQNPFLLTLICFLSDLNESIPSTLTALYSTFVHRMLIRASKKGAAGNDFDRSNWKDCQLLEILGCLALWGAVTLEYRFSEDTMREFLVTSEYFRSGLLHYRSDPVGLAQNCDFPHRSIQDFLAAFYAVHYWGEHTLKEATGLSFEGFDPEMAVFFSELTAEVVIVKHCYSDSQFGRFYFGLISNRHEFDDRVRAFAKVFLRGDQFFNVTPSNFVQAELYMSDCSEMEQFAAGKIFNDVADRIADPNNLYTEMGTIKNRFLRSRGNVKKTGSFGLGYLPLSDYFLKTQFCRGLQLTRDYSGQEPEIVCVSTENPKRLRILWAYVGDEFTTHDIDKLVYSHVSFLALESGKSRVQNHFAALERILTQIPSVNRLELIGVVQPHQNVHLQIRVEAQQSAALKCFSINYLYLGVSKENGLEVLENIRSATQIQLTILPASPSTEEWNYKHMFVATISVDNGLSNLDIWNAIKPESIEYPMPE